MIEEPLLREIKSTQNTGLFESLANALPVLVWMSDASKACVWFNQEWLQFTGRTLEQEMGYGWLSGVHPDDYDHCLEIYIRHFDLQLPFEMEYRLRHHTGAYRWILDKGSPRYDDAGAFAGYTGACIDITDRKKVADERNRFFRVATDILVIAGADGYFKKINAACERVLGWTPDEICALPWHTFVHPDDLERTKAEAAANLAGKQVIAFENRYRHKDGSYRWLSWRTEPDVEEQLIYAAAVDITTRKKIEDALKNALERYNLAVNGTLDGIWDWNLLTNEVYFSPRAKEMLGYADHEIPDDIEAWRSRLHPDDRDATWSTVEAYLRSATQAYDISFRMRHRDGTWRWIQSRAVALRDQTGKAYRMTGAHTDITAQRQLQEDLKDSESRFRTLTEAMPQLVWIDRASDGWCEYLNSQWEAYSGVPVSRLLGFAWLDLVHPDDRARTAAALQDAVAERAEYNIEYRIRRHDGVYHWFKTRGVPVRDETGAITVWYGTCTDIQELIEAREKAEAASISKSEFLANMSHEIRTPMNVVVGIANLLAISSPLTARQKEFVQTLQLSADTLLTLINDLLDIARIEARTMEMEKIPFSLSQLMESIISIMSVRAAEKQLTFTFDGACIDGQLFISDPARIRQMLMNLCSNAIKFTETGGVHIAIDCQPFDPPADRPPAPDAGQWDRVRITVKDSGIGIAADKLETIFSKFVQADTSINRKYGGTGLGLAITETLAGIMGGSIAVKSVLGRGSLFTLCLPLQQASAAKASPGPQRVAATPSAAHAARRPCVLLVEDYAPNALVASAFLEQFAYDCDVATNGVEAVEKVKTGNGYSASRID